IADAGHVLYRYQPMPPARAVFPSTPAIRFLQSHVGDWRFTAVSPAFHPDAGMVYGLRDTRGLDPPFPSEAYWRLVHLGNPEVRIDADMQQRGLVVLSDQWFRGWSVTVDGRPARPVRVDTAIRGVVVGAGSHEIVWRYRTPGFIRGIVISGVALLVGGAGLLL